MWENVCFQRYVEPNNVKVCIDNSLIFEKNFWNILYLRTYFDMLIAMYNTNTE